MVKRDQSVKVWKEWREEGQISRQARSLWQEGKIGGKEERRRGWLRAELGVGERVGGGKVTYT